MSHDGFTLTRLESVSWCADACSFVELAPQSEDCMFSLKEMLVFFSFLYTHLCVAKWALGMGVGVGGSFEKCLLNSVLFLRGEGVERCGGGGCCGWSEGWGC